MTAPVIPPAMNALTATPQALRRQSSASSHHKVICPCLVAAETAIWARYPHMVMVVHKCEDYRAFFG